MFSLLKKKKGKQPWKPVESLSCAKIIQFFNVLSYVRTEIPMLQKPVHRHIASCSSREEG